MDLLEFLIFARGVTTEEVAFLLKISCDLSDLLPCSG